MMSGDEDGGRVTVYTAPVVIKDHGVVWCDGALIANDGSVFEHQFRNRPLASLMRRKIHVDRKADSGDFVSSREISLYVTGRCRRRTSGFSIHWHCHSDLIYLLTGVTYCAQIYVECGRDLADGGVEVYAEPRVSLVRARDPSTGITQVSWSQVAGIWPRDVSIQLVRLPANTPAARPPVAVSPNVGTIGFSRVRLGGETTLHAAYVPLIVGDRNDMSGTGLEMRLRLDCETSLFLERASSVYRRLLAVERELESSIGRRREILLTCLHLASTKRLMLVDGTSVVNLFVAQVCLYGLGEESCAQEIVGVLYRRRDQGDALFDLHNQALANAAQLALLLRRIYDYAGHLPVVDERMDAGDPMVLTARSFYVNDFDVGIGVIAMAAEVLRKFSLRGSIEDAVSVLRGRVPLNGCVDRGDVIRVLQL